MAKTLYVETEITGHVEGLSRIADAVTNSCLQAIRHEMDKQGLHGGLRDSRKLRAELHAIVSRDVVEQALTAMMTNVEETEKITRQ